MRFSPTARSIAVLTALCLWVSCSGDSSGPTPLPTLTAVTPNSAAQGTSTTVTVTGTNFVVGGATTLAFSGTGITVTNVSVTSTTSATALVAIAANAPLGTRTLTLTAASGASGTLNFTVLPAAPTLASVSAATVVAGTTVTETLTGTNFVSGATTVAVSGAGVTVGTVNVSSATSLTASFVIDAAADLGARNVTVTTAGGTTAPRTVTINPAVPTLASLNPGSGQTGTTVRVTLTGSSFVPGATTVNVAGTGVTVSNVTVSDQALLGSSAVGGTATSIAADFVISTSATPGAHAVTVTTSGGTSNALSFSVNTPSSPAIGSFVATPTTIDLGQSATLTWSGVTNATTCTIDNGVGVVSCAGGTVTVQPTVTTAYILTATGPGGTVIANATVTLGGAAIGSFTANPTSIVLGNSSTLSWSTIRNALDCFIDNGIGRVTCGEQNISVSPAATTTYTLTVSGPLGSTTATTVVTVNTVLPTLTAVTPSSGLEGTTVAVTLTGTNFVVGGTTVAVGGAGVTVNSVAVASSTSLTANFVIAGGATAGAHNVTVTTASGTSAPQTFSVIPLPPTLASVNPNQGAQGGAQSITLTGTHFVPGATSVIVSGDSVTVSNINVSSATQLTATFTVGLLAAVGARDVTVMTTGGTTAPQAFTVIAGPVINSFAALSTHLNLVQPTAVAWTTSNATSCSILPTFFSVACPSGSGIVTPGANTTYTMTASNAGASVNATSNVFVNEPGRWVFSAARNDNQLRMFSFNSSTGSLTPIGGGTVGVGAGNSAPVSVAVDPAGKYAYAVNNGSTNISMYTINSSTGALTSNGQISASGTNTQAIRVDPTGRFAYVVNAGPFPGNGSVNAYSINGSGQLVALNSGVALPAGTQPVDLTINALGRFVYLANSTTNDLSIYSINANGGPTSNGTLTFVGTQPQIGAGGVAADPSGRFLYATTRAQGAPAKVIPYSIASNGTLIAGTPVNGSGTMGPVAVDPTGRFVFALDINNSFIWAYRINQTTGDLTAVNAPLTGPAPNGPNSLAVDPQGKFVYTTNSIGTISTFSIDQSTGAVALINTTASGTNPRGIVVSR